MSQIKGTIEAASCKEGNDHPKYGMSYQTSIKVKGEWYGAFTRKTAEELGLGKGKLVSFTFTENGKYKNFDPKSLAVSTSTAPAAASTSTSTSSGSAPARSGFNEAGVKVGHAINNAVQLAIANKATDLKSIHGLAVDILTLSVKLESQYEKVVTVAKKKMDEATAPAAEPEEAPAPKPKAKPAAKAKPKPEPEPEVEEEAPPAPPEQAAEPDFDDDIPF